jgi:hypothetical protein
MELLHRDSELKQRMIAEQFGGLDGGLVGRDRRAIREKIETEPKIRKWFQALTRLSAWVRFGRYSFALTIGNVGTDRQCFFFSCTTHLGGLG